MGKQTFFLKGIVSYKITESLNGKGLNLQEVTTELGKHYNLYWKKF